VSAAQPPKESPQKRILIAEDDAAIATMLLKVLRQHYEVIHAADGPTALSLAAEMPSPQLLMLDVMLPGADGYVVASRVRAIPHLKNVPIIFLTARTAAGDVIRGIQHGARHYIHKPFKIDDVLAKVKKTIGE
jgi:DNA-binding response OmpR family regulator